MSKLIVKATDFLAITASEFPNIGYFIIGIDTKDGGFKKMDHLGVITSIGGADLPFNGNRVVTRQGLPAVNVGPTLDVNEFVDKMFFPAQGPNLYMSAPSVREFGDSLMIPISYTVIRNTNPVTGILVDGNSIGPDGTGNQSGTVARTLLTFTNTTFNGSVTDGSNTGYASASINWYNKRFDFVNNTDFLDPAQTDSQLSVMLNSLSSAAYTYSNAKSGSNTMTPSNQYMYFCYVLVGNEAVPNIIVNTIANNAYTVRDFTYVNQFGFSTRFRLIRSGNRTSGTFNVSIG